MNSNGEILMRSTQLLFVSAASVLLLAACSDNADLPASAGYGPKPTLPAEKHALISTVYPAKAASWPAGLAPTPAAGLAVKAFATQLEHPRWLYVLPNGDVLVAEADAPSRPGNTGGLMVWARRKVMAWAGSGAAPSAKRITLLRDADGDGVAEVKSSFITGLNAPHGMALVGDTLYVANTDAVVKFTYRAGATHIDGPGTKVVDLPAGTRNHHWVKNVIASPDGSKLFVSTGSNSNVGENGMVAEEG
jgi:glucose/arabinose dehydrogenase